MLSVPDRRERRRVANRLGTGRVRPTGCSGGRRRPHDRGAIGASAIPVPGVRRPLRCGAHPGTGGLGDRQLHRPTHARCTGSDTPVAQRAPGDTCRSGSHLWPGSNGYPQIDSAPRPEISLTDRGRPSPAPRWAPPVGIAAHGIRAAPALLLVIHLGDDRRDRDDVRALFNPHRANALTRPPHAPDIGGWNTDHDTGG